MIDEERRLKALQSYEVLDTLPEQAYDDIVDLASQLCGAPIALISLIDSDRQWFKARVGLAARETPRDVAFCAHAIVAHTLFTVTDATRDARFADNPLVVGDPAIRFYAGMPLRTDGDQFLGTLCVLDRTPRQLTEAQANALRALARQVEALLEARRQTIALRHLQQDKDELAAFLVHDLKNHAAGVLGSCDAVLAMPQLAPEVRELTMDARLSGESVLRLTLNLLDLEKNATGGLSVRTVSIDAQVLVEAVIRRAHARVALYHARITCDARRAGAVLADEDLIGRVIDNLIDNALKYSPPGSHIHVDVQRTPQTVRFYVRDEGVGVAPQDHKRIFDKYVRLGTREVAGSRGLGLAFCRAAIEAHGGAIWVESAGSRGSTFCFELPTA